MNPALPESYWICPWCRVANFRDHEGMDECVHCGSETHTRFQGFEDRLVVTLAREPENNAAYAPK